MTAKTLADMTSADRVGMWCEDQDGDLMILECVYESCVSVFHPPSGDRLRYLASELTPRLDLPRAWTPTGDPVPGEWEERTDQDGIGDRIWFTRQRRYITEWEVAP